MWKRNENRRKRNNNFKIRIYSASKLVLKYCKINKSKAY